VTAMYNFWDHVPPTFGTGGGADVDTLRSAGAVIDTTGARLAQPNCP